ncbi:sensor histidine kinase [Curtobacterium sp. ISL-83]|uniref:sensor histidine kinase n=1 Tax=Curtobacterium sp. ISL-83 TaxID=2819145 RepID=UPI001BE5052D|nr:histidine kinase [Curtobacterium sp. ISL-83]MBT2501340.1 hypothetical protein [Curtobacterium sp. ISL-83]
MHSGPSSTTPDEDTPRPDGRRRFGRFGRVLPVALVQVLGTLGASRFTGSAAGGGPPWARHVVLGPVDAVAVGPVALGLLLAGIVLLPWRWRWPRAVLVGTLVTTVAYAVVVSPRGPFVAALTMAMANAWLRGHRWAVGVVAAISVVTLPAADLVLGRSPALDPSAVLLALAWATVTIAVSELARVRIERVAERRRQRVEAERRRAEAERVRIARELHDSVAHAMSLINLQAGVALHLGSDLPEQTQQALGNIRDASRDALVELRTILGVLRAVDADAFGSDRDPTPGMDRIPALVERARAAGVDIAATVAGDPGRLDAITDRNGFRIVQESVTNVMKHAPGHRVVITVDVGPDVVDLTVRDHPATTRPPRAGVSQAGPALPGPTAGLPATGLGPTGNGIIGMRERADAVGGTLAAAPTADGGWQVTARLPVRGPVAEATARATTFPDTGATR